MVDSLVQTKLFLPRVRRELVARPRLNDELERARHAALVLVSAPAGFGKTTLLASVMAGRSMSGLAGQAVAWVSMDARDGDATRSQRLALLIRKSHVERVGAEVDPHVEGMQLIQRQPDGPQHIG